MSSGSGIWWEAARPRTLPAAVAPILVGMSAAVAEGAPHKLVDPLERAPFRDDPAPGDLVRHLEAAVVLPHHPAVGLHELPLCGALLGLVGGGGRALHHALVALERDERQLVASLLVHDFGERGCRWGKHFIFSVL